ncbi:hypothetical protein O3P69_010306 [Scylla paramamosain]|uniref:Uncharacterized protein n=1 Tax=Scylla paramamosain TaxID=85552 RepID=A0AAW0TSR6_SCYPA
MRPRGVTEEGGAARVEVGVTGIAASIRKSPERLPPAAAPSGVLRDHLNSPTSFLHPPQPPLLLVFSVFPSASPLLSTFSLSQHLLASLSLHPASVSLSQPPSDCHRPPCRGNRSLYKQLASVITRVSSRTASLPTTTTITATTTTTTTTTTTAVLCLPISQCQTKVAPARWDVRYLLSAANVPWMETLTGLTMLHVPVFLSGSVFSVQC